MFKASIILKRLGFRGEKEESAAGVSVDPQIPEAGVAEGAGRPDCVQRYVALTCMCRHTEMSMWNTPTAGATYK